jgi:hypothetical protein
MSDRPDSGRPHLPTPSPLPFLAAALLLALSPVLIRAQPSAGTPPFTVQLDDVHPDANSTVTFTVAPGHALPYASIQNLELVDAKNGTGDYRVQIDLSSMSRGKYGRFGFSLYANRTGQFENTVYAFDVYEDPFGTFNDTIRQVSIRLGPNGTPFLGTVPVPIHSSYGPPSALLYADSKSVQHVRMGTETDFTIRLDSALDLGASLADPAATATCDSCVQTPIPVKLSTNRLSPNDHVDVVLKVQPNTFNAMGASAHRSALDYDADVNLSIPVTADQGGSQRTQQIAVHIQFSPPVVFMALIVITGTLAGAFVRMLLVYFAGKSWLWPEFWTGTITALIVWALAVAVFSAGHATVEYMGLKFDPTQLLSAGLLTFLAGAGPVFLKALDNSILGKISGGK